VARTEDKLLPNVMVPGYVFQAATALPGLGPEAASRIIGAQAQFAGYYPPERRRQAALRRPAGRITTDRALKIRAL